MFTLAEGRRVLGRGDPVSVERAESDGRDGDRPARPAPGDELTFCVRPEQLRVGAETNQIRGTVVDTEFQGATTRVRLDWGGTELVVAVEDGGEKSDAAFEVGTTLEVGFALASAHIVE